MSGHQGFYCATTAAEATPLARLLAALRDTYDAEGVVTYLDYLANRAEGLAGGPVSGDPS